MTDPKITIQSDGACHACGGASYRIGPAAHCSTEGCEYFSPKVERIEHNHRLEVAAFQSARLATAIERLIWRLDRFDPGKG